MTIGALVTGPMGHDGVSISVIYRTKTLLRYGLEFFNGPTFLDVFQMNDIENPVERLVQIIIQTGRKVHLNIPGLGLIQNGLDPGKMLFEIVIERQGNPDIGHVE